MILHETGRSPAHRIDDLQLLQGLLTQRLYLPEQDRRLLRVLLAEAPRQPQARPRATRRAPRRWRAGGAALALGGALVLAFGSPLLPAIAASPSPATWIASVDRADATLASSADQSDVLLRALLNHGAAANAAVAPADQSDVLLRALLNHSAAANTAVAPADQSDMLLRALLNRATADQAAAPAEQMLPQADAALAQAELAVGETLVIPAAPAADALAAPPSSADQQAVRYYVVKSGDTLSGIAQFYYGNGNLWPAIYNANTDKIRDPHWIYPNQQFVIPAAPGITGVATPTAPYQQQAVGSISQYTVQSGDTLSGIAAYVYGNGNAWWGIFQANTDKIYNPDLIFPGQVLRIP